MGNPFWVDVSLLERLEQWMGMETECEGGTEQTEVAGLVQEPRGQQQGAEEESEDDFLEQMWRLASTEREEQMQHKILLTEFVQ